MIAPTSRPELCSNCAKGNVGACVYAAYDIGRGPCADRRAHWDAGYRLALGRVEDLLADIFSEARGR